MLSGIFFRLDAFLMISCAASKLWNECNGKFKSESATRRIFARLVLLVLVWGVTLTGLQRQAVPRRRLLTISGTNLDLYYYAASGLRSVLYAPSSLPDN